MSSRTKASVGVGLLLLSCLSLSVLALRSEPWLRLLSAHPIGLSPAAGDASSSLDVRFPLKDDLRID